MVSEGYPRLCCYQTLTWLTSFSLHGDVYLLVDGSGSSLVTLHFLARAFLSVPPKYFHPVMHRASFFGLTWYSSCISCWVIPSPNLFIILYVTIAANSLVGLFGFSVTNLSFAATRVMVSLNHLFLSSGRSILCQLFSGSLNHPGIVFT